MSAPISEAAKVAAELCKKFEGLRLKPYICPAGYPTQGYGTVIKPDGSRVKMEDPPITKEVAESWLMTELRKTYIPGVLKASPHLAAYPNTLGALSSFAYNLGVPRYRASTLRKRINDRDWVSAKTEIMKWVRAGGKVLPGLVRRRKAEAELL